MRLNKIIKKTKWFYLRFHGDKLFYNFSVLCSWTSQAFKSGILKEDRYNKKGVTLVEILIIMAIMALLITGSSEFFIHTMKVQNLTYSQDSEEKLREQLAKVDEGACTNTFSNKKVGESINEIKDEFDQTLIELSSSNNFFDRNLKVINISTRSKIDPCNSIIVSSCNSIQASEPGDCPPGCTDPTIPPGGSAPCGGTNATCPPGCIDPATFPGTCGGTRATSIPGYAEMEIAFSRPGSFFETKKRGGVCTSSDQTDCYKQDCILRLSGSPLPSGVAGTDIGSCELLSCSNINFLNKNISCYTMADDLTGQGITSLGCGAPPQQEKTTSLGFSTGITNSGQGKFNTFIGYQAGKKNIKPFNTFIGYQAGEKNAIGELSTFIGYRAGQNNKGEENTFIGSEAGQNSDSSSYNTFIGYQAGQNSEGNNNFFIGSEAGKNNKGNSNFFIGSEAGRQNTNGKENIFIGYQAGRQNADGEKNTFIGSGAGRQNTNGKENTFIGYRAGQQNTGDSNFFLGHQAGAQNSTGEKNTFIGHQAGQNNTTGNSNVFIGYKAGSGSNYDNHFVVGNELNNEWITGEIKVSTDPNPPSFKINGQQVAYWDPITNTGHTHISSSRTLKKNIKSFKSFDKALEDILNMPLFTFEFKKDKPQKKRIGFISEELPPHLQIKDKLSRPDMTSIRGTILAGIKALYNKIKTLKEEFSFQIKNLKTEILKEIKANVKGLKEELFHQLKDLSKNLETTREELSLEIKKKEQISLKREDLIIAQEKKKMASLTEKLHKKKEELSQVKADLASTKKEMKNIKEQLKTLEEKFSSLK
ncbi:MAG: prepilin-type N-terminal cleavage/methylation domain-containing protein [Bdellovibrionales bacterium]|nr:prepilin-type N-terminal cleavage/methylation domain-containing protein [Bdellovibrionales bacterium]